MILISNQEKGYFITATINHGSYIPEALHVERIDDMALIRKGLGLYPDYRNWRDDFDPSFVAELDVMQ